MSFQFPLDFRLRVEATLDRFVTGPNAELIDRLQQLAEGDEQVLIYITGPEGYGKTHLLQAAARLVDESMYIPLASIQSPAVEMFEGLETRQLLCIDDVEQLAGNNKMEVALFSLMKRIKDQSHSIVLAATTPPDQSGFDLNDLVSRLNGCMQYQLRSPDEADIRLYLKRDAGRRGIDLGDEVIDWIMTHMPRDMKSLSERMNKLDTESLRTQRRITIPFIKDLS